MILDVELLLRDFGAIELVLLSPVTGGLTILITYMKKLLDSGWLRKECKNV